MVMSSSLFLFGKYIPTSGESHPVREREREGGGDQHGNRGVPVLRKQLRYAPLRGIQYGVRGRGWYKSIGEKIKLKNYSKNVLMVGGVEVD